MTKIHWSNAVDGGFDIAADWDAGVAPGAKDRAFLGAFDGSAYTVTASADEIVRGLRIAANATLAITGGVFVVRRDIGNSGVIALGAASGDVRLEITGATTLSGGGQIVLADDKSGFISATRRHHGDLVNVDNTISGAGRMEGLGFRFDNQAAGVVNATGAHNLVLKHVVCTNEGLLEGTGAGGLTLKATATINNGPTGVIFAGDGSVVHLRGVSISGGTFESAGSGKFVVTGSTSKKSGAFWYGVNSTVHNQARVRIVQATLSLSGAIDNSGAIFGKRGFGELLVRGNNATLTGGGSITLHRFNTITGDTSRSTLTNVDNTISGSGAIGIPLGAEGLSLVNAQNGVIDASGRQGLTINTGANKVKNDGLIEASGRGVGDVVSGVINNGTLMAAGGKLTVERAVTGTGSGVIDGGTLAFGSSFTEDVAFSGTSGMLVLAQSQGYAGAVSGFSLTGGTSLDLRDIGFTGADEATFSGDAASGVLTVTDGTHTAHITLLGNYAGAAFVASSDGRGGVEILASNAPGGGVAARAHRLDTQPHHQFIAAMAGFGGDRGGPAFVASDSPRIRLGMLSVPRMAMA